MPIGITAEHEELGDVVRRFVEANAASSGLRSVVDADPDSTRVAQASFWSALCALGLTALAIPESLGGAGYGSLELAVVLEELGRGCVPGPYLPTVLAGVVLTDAAPGETAKALLLSIASGARVATVALTGTLRGEPAPGGLRVSGSLEPVLCGAGADIALVAVARGEGADLVWCALELDDAAVTVTTLES